MDRCAVLVDAGYLYAEGGKLCCGTASRSHSALQPSLAVELLQAVALEATSCLCCAPTGTTPLATGSAPRHSVKLPGWPT
jgi:hypothetical protein